MPKLGFNMSAGKLIQWYKKEGDPLKKGEPFFSIETDKTAIDIEASRDGVFLKKLIEEGDTVEVTLPIAIVGQTGEDVSGLIGEIGSRLNSEETITPDPPAQAAASAGDEPITEERAKSQVKISPRAKKAAEENGLDPKALEIVGTGFDGGICERDVLDYLETHRVRASAVAKKIAAERGIALDEVQGSGVSGRIMKRDLEGTAAERTTETTDRQPGGQYTPDGKEILETVPYDGVRRIIGERLSESKSASPHVYFTQKADLTRLLDLRKQINGAQERKTSVTDFIAKACAIAIGKYPEVNESLVGSHIVRYKTVNLGIAVAAPKGLIVPVIRDAERKSVLEIARDSSALIDKARAGKLTPAEYSGGTFTISNLGMFGIVNFTAVINPPEAAILAVSAARDEPVVVVCAEGNKAIEIRPMMNITLSVDHRVIDGLLAAQYVTEVRRLLENPIELVL
jgi:pyruvate dehydrogenase E2 component (dihydrolipoamide acetyltransferase)